MLAKEEMLGVEPSEQVQVYERSVCEEQSSQSGGSGM